MMQEAPPEFFERYKRLASAMGLSDYSNKIVHYTTVDAFRGILESKELWFGGLPDMPDTTEGLLFLNAVLEAMPRLIAGTDLPGLAKIIEQCRSAVRDETYVSSWCEYFDAEPHGRLSMWREYANKATGVALVADSSSFLPSVLDARQIMFHVMVAKIDYVRRDRAIDHANDLLKRVSNVDFVNAALEDKITIATLLLAKAPCVKHDGYSEEAEVRYLYAPGLFRLLGRQLPDARYAHANGRKYFAMPLRNYDDYGLDLRLEQILKKVIIGSAGDQGQRESSVRQLLDQHGLQHVPIHRSDIPIK